MHISGTLVLLISACVAPSQAAPNGLTQIPIAKVFGDGVASFSVARTEESSSSTVYTTQYGIGNQIELGLDYEAAPGDQRTFLGNAKALLAHRPGHLPDIAVGLQNIATGQKAVPYVVATTQPRATGVSLGAIRPGGGAYYGMAGLSYNVTPTVEIVADEIGGQGSYGTLGAVANITKEITVNVAYARPNSAGTADDLHPDGYIFNIAYTYHLKGGNKGEGGGVPKNPSPAQGNK